MIRLAIRRPVATLTATAAVAALGVPALLDMPLELLPDVTFPRLTVHATWWGASPEMVEAFVTSPIESAAQGVTGVESVSSTSYPQRGEVTVEFARGTDMEFARLELSERLAALARDLPPGSRRPEVQPWVPEEFATETQALLTYTLAGRTEPGALRDLALDHVRPRFLAIEGVDVVQVRGGTDRELKVTLDPVRMNALGLSPDDVGAALGGTLNVEETATFVLESGREWTVTIDDRAASVAAVENLVLRPATVDTLEGSPRPAVRLSDVGRAILGRARPTRLHRVDGHPAVSLYVYREPGSNMVAVSDRTRERIGAIEASLPPGHRLIEERDASERIRAELTDVGTRAAIAAFVVLVVLLLAFRRMRPAVLAFGTIAVSVLVAAVLMDRLGLSLNLLTLAGIAMGLGLVVDNAIVVLESVEARRARGEPGAMAAERGARQVFLPVLAATATTAIVFLPFPWFQGELRAYYVPFAITVALVLAASLAVSFTAVPAVAARLGTEDRAPGERGEPLPRRVYRGLLSWTLAWPKTTALVALLILAGATWIFWNDVPRGRTWGGFGEQTYIHIQIQLPRGAELERTDALARVFETKLATLPEVERFVTDVTPEHAAIRVTFPDSLETTWVPVAIKERMVAYSHGFGGVDVRVYGYGPSFYGGGGGPPTYSLELRGYGYLELETIAEDLAARLRRFPRIRHVDPNAAGRWFERDKEVEWVLEPDRARLSGYGMSARELMDRTSAYTRGQIARDVVRVGGEEIDLQVKLAGADHADVEALADLTLATREGRPVRVRDVAELRPRETLGRIVREGQQYQRIVAWEFRGPPKLGDRVRDAVVASTALPPGYTIETERSWWEYEQGEKRRLAGVLALAAALVFMVTAALFESYRAPLVVLASVPLALIGVFLVWFWSGATFTREAWIGVVMMAGIVVNNAILVVDRIGARHQGGDGPALGLKEAALEGTLDRVRPILMTTATTVVGLLPLVLFTGSVESSLWRSLAMATIGGLLASTVVVLVTIPALYVLVSAETCSAGEG
ncbi:MAG: efflux RND transporter permease subunit [Gemmatimonadota bacterium]|nr:efflux RND transporter permease subunit [Gemmatimonadota bacterium]